MTDVISIRLRDWCSRYFEKRGRGGEGVCGRIRNEQYLIVSVGTDEILGAFWCYQRYTSRAARHWHCCSSIETPRLPDARIGIQLGCREDLKGGCVLICPTLWGFATYIKCQVPVSTVSPIVIHPDLRFAETFFHLKKKELPVHVANFDCQEKGIFKKFAKLVPDEITIVLWYFSLECARVGILKKTKHPSLQMSTQLSITHCLVVVSL